MRVERCSRTSPVPTTRSTACKASPAQHGKDNNAKHHKTDPEGETMLTHPTGVLRRPRALGRALLIALLGLLILGTNSALALTATTTVLTSSINPSYVSQNTVLTATVTPSAATGTVTFKDGSTTLGTGTISAGVATLTKSFTTTGSHSLTAVYAGNTTYATSTSAAKTQTVNAKVNSTTVLTTSVNPSYVSQSVTLTATVTGTSPSGTVTFKDGTTTLGTGTVAAGVATFAASFSTTGSHSLTAVYAGNTANNASTSAAKTQTVNAKVASTTVLTSSVNPTYVGQSTTLTATVTGTSPTGTVTFKDGTTTLGTGTIAAGVATFAASFTTTGSHSLTAVYAGNTANNASTSAAKTQTVNAKVASSTALSSSINPSTAGQSVTLTATVTGTSPSGTVTFKDGATTLGSGTLSAGATTFATSFSTTGAHSLTAVYAGDTANNTSTSTVLTQTVNPAAPVPTTLLLNASSGYVASGASVTLTASISGSAPTGPIVFSDGSTPIATVTLSAGVATTSPVLSGAWLHNLTARYAGDTYNLASDSNSIGVQVSATAAATPGPMTWIYGYDAQGNPWIDLDPKGKETTRDFDSLNRPTQLVRPAPAGSATPTVIGMAYDGQDNLTSVVDPRNLATTYTVDGLKNVKVQASPDTGATNATFDAAGNLLTRTDSRGKLTTYAYDALNRLTSATYATGTPTVFQYDGGASPGPNSAGRLTKITDESGSTSYTYDALGRVLTKTQVTGIKTMTLTYTWGSTGSATGSLTSVTYPSGSRVNYSYDAAGRPSGITVNPVNANGVGTNTASTITVLNAVTYNGENNVTGWTWSDGSVYQRSFDSFGRLSSYPLGKATGSGTAAGLLRTLMYDDAGQIIGYTHTRSGVAQPQFDQGFSYDDLGQLQTTTQSTTTYAYSYDASGNRTLRTVGGTSYTQTIAATSNRLTQNQSASGNTSFGYDNAGNMLSDATATYVYSDRGRMSSATIGANTVSYKYNGLAQRVSKTGPTAVVSTGAAYYAYDEAGQLLGEYDANMAPAYETVYLGSTPVAVLKQTGTAATSTLLVTSYNAWADHIDTPRVVTRSADQAIVWRWDTAEAFGATPPDQNPSALGTFAFNQRFPGQLLDAETGNFYNWHRDFKPNLGRYVQSDPIGLAGGVNTFAYVGGIRSALLIRWG
jgi:RHS repeat-associated protein